MFRETLKRKMSSKPGSLTYQKVKVSFLNEGKRALFGLLTTKLASYRKPRTCRILHILPIILYILKFQKKTIKTQIFSLWVQLLRNRALCYPSRCHTNLADMQRKSAIVVSVSGRPK